MLDSFGWFVARRGAAAARVGLEEVAAAPVGADDPTLNGIAAGRPIFLDSFGWLFERGATGATEGTTAAVVVVVLVYGAREPPVSPIAKGKNIKLTDASLSTRPDATSGAVGTVGIHPDRPGESKSSFEAFRVGIGFAESISRSIEAALVDSSGVTIVEEDDCSDASSLSDWEGEGSATRNQHHRDNRLQRRTNSRVR